MQKPKKPWKTKQVQIKSKKQIDDLLKQHRSKEIEICQGKLFRSKDPDRATRIRSQARQLQKNIEWINSIDDEEKFFSELEKEVYPRLQDLIYEGSLGWQVERIENIKDVLVPGFNTSSLDLLRTYSWIQIKNLKFDEQQEEFFLKMAEYIKFKNSNS